MAGLDKRETGHAPGTGEATIPACAGAALDADQFHPATAFHVGPLPARMSRIAARKAHSSFCSSRIASMKRVTASSLGRVPTTSVPRIPARRDAFGQDQCGLPVTALHRHRDAKRSSQRSLLRAMGILSSAAWRLRVAQRMSRATGSADGLAAAAEEIRLTLTFPGGAMRQDSTVPQRCRSVPGVTMPDRRGFHAAERTASSNAGFRTPGAGKVHASLRIRNRRSRAAWPAAPHASAAAVAGAGRVLGCVRHSPPGARR